MKLRILSILSELKNFVGKNAFFISLQTFRLYNNFMIRRIVERHSLKDHNEIKQNLQYWMSRPAGERLAAIDLIRRQIYGDAQRLQRTVRVIQRS